MNVLVNEEWIDEIKGLVTSEESEEMGSRYRYSTGRGKTKLSISAFSDQSLFKLHEFLKGKADAGDRAARLSQSVVKTWMEIKTNPDGQVVSKLENIPSAMRAYIGTSPCRYVFEQSKDGNFVPWFVKCIVYHDADKNQAAYVHIELNGINTGSGSSGRRGSDRDLESTCFSISVSDIRKKTMSQILAAKGYYLETEERMESYGKEVKKYLEYCDVDGFQMSVTGKCKLLKGWSDSNFRPVGQDGRPAKMVMDPPGTERGTDSCHAPFWDRNEDICWVLPIHPVFEMFDLDEHADYRVHVNNAEPYVYNDKVDQKLVLPGDVKQFLTVLIQHAKNKFEDIIGGKEGGTIVLIEGGPGIGKTLTAEVYSEKMHRPLYKVQSSQLGIDVDTVEKNLKEVLRRSERWGAILLLDEADVYIRERGSDIHQNAIVGVFLRVLEYYRGVLFMTTNLGDTVDDAIVSRTTARFQYEMPSEEDQIKLWKVMSEQNNVKLSDVEIRAIFNFMPHLSGRDIKNLMKLAMVVVTNEGGRITPEVLMFVSRFKQSGRKVKV